MHLEEEWPRNVKQPEVEQQLLELKKEQTSCAVNLEEFLEIRPKDEITMVTKVDSLPQPSAADRYLELFSSWYKLKKYLIYWVRINRWAFWKNKASLTEERIRNLRSPISTDDLARAEWGILRYLQREFLKPDGLVSSKHDKLRPVIVEGLIRVGGRLGRADIDPGSKHPVLLPPAPVVKALVRRIHLEEGHACPQRVWSKIMRKYWILNGRRIVSEVNRTCLVCRRYKALLREPLMDDLHDLWVLGEDRPFFNAGIDYFGPLPVKVNRSTQKRYGCLITCLQTRAIHLELAWSLTMDSCLNAMLRLASRLGMPKNMQSDNGTNMVSTSKEMKQMINTWDEEKMRNKMLEKGCKWKFNAPSASHMGGAWERMIRSVRSILLYLSTEQMMTDEGLMTALTISDDIVNNCPITPISTHLDDCSALTPNHFLRMDTGVLMPMASTDDKDAYSRRWRQIQHVANVFWKRWRSEYLPTLQVRNKWYRSQKNLEVGDLVIVQEPNAARNQWPLARVIRVFPDEEGTVRVVEIKTGAGTFRRPVHKLCLLEAVR